MKKNKKKYSIEQRYAYHWSRRCGYGGLPTDNPKALYSDGFIEGAGLKQINNASGVESEFGKRAARSYQFGWKRGVAAKKRYLSEHGHPLVYVAGKEKEWKRKGWLYKGYLGG